MGPQTTVEFQQKTEILDSGNVENNVGKFHAAILADQPALPDFAGDDPMPDDVRQMIYGPDHNGIPKTAYAMHAWQLDAWEKQSHQHYLWFTICRGSFGDYDGYVLPVNGGHEGYAASAYVHGWLDGRRSVQAEDAERLAGDERERN